MIYCNSVCWFKICIADLFQRLKEQLRQQHVNNHFGGGNNNIISRAMTEAVDMVTSQHNGISSHQPANQVFLQAPQKDEQENQQENRRGG